MAVLSPSTFSIALGSDDPTVSYSGAQGNARTAFTVNITTLLGLVPERSHFGVTLGSLTLYLNPDWFSPLPKSDIFVNLSLVTQSILGSQLTQTLYIIPLGQLPAPVGPGLVQATFRPFEVIPLVRQTTSDLRYQTRVTLTLTDSFGVTLVPNPAIAAEPLSQYVTRADLNFTRLG